VILVVALNPALDVTHHVAGADWSGVNRPIRVAARAGGKGLNVARVLRALGQPVTLTGLAGGPTGQALVDGLAGTGIEVALTPITGETRRTFAVVDTVRGETALFNEPGPAIDAGEYQRFFVGYERRLGSSAAVVLSGSLPAGVPADAYAGLIAAAASAGVPVVLDTSGAALGHGAAAGPTLVKPNLAELEAAAGQPLGGADDGPDLAAVESAAHRLAGPQAASGSAERPPAQAAARTVAVVVSLGPHGLLAAGAHGTWVARPPGPVAGNPTGAGDAVVAGLADGLVRGRDWPDVLRHATAVGTAAAAAPVAGEFSLAEYERLVPAVSVTQMEKGARR
jgi:tagatose 6-phosphate kinase